MSEGYQSKENVVLEETSIGDYVYTASHAQKTVKLFIEKKQKGNTMSQNDKVSTNRDVRDMIQTI